MVLTADSRTRTGRDDEAPANSDRNPSPRLDDWTGTSKLEDREVEQALRRGLEDALADRDLNLVLRIEELAADLGIELDSRRIEARRLPRGEEAPVSASAYAEAWMDVKAEGPADAAGAIIPLETAEDHVAGDLLGVAEGPWSEADVPVELIPPFPDPLPIRQTSQGWGRMITPAAFP